MTFRRVILTLCFLFLALSGHTATYYASADGSSTAGTSALPWSVPYSVTNSTLAPGDTVLFKSGGTFVCTDWYSGFFGTNRLKFERSGTPGAKITYKSETLWGFSFDGSLFLPVTSSNIVIHGFRVFSHDTTNRNVYYSYTHPSAIVEFGHGNEILHNLLENGGHGAIGSWKTTAGKYIAGNVVRFNGGNDYSTDSGTDWAGAPRGTGMYLQNLTNTAEALIQGNILYFNYTESLYAHGTDAEWQFNFRHNICLPITYGIYYDQHEPASQGVQMRSNYVWTSQGVTLDLGTERNYAGGGTNTFLTDNYLVSGNLNFQVRNGQKQLTLTNNTVVNLFDPAFDATPWYPLIWSFGGTLNPNGYPQDLNFDWNTYFVRQEAGYGKFQFYISNVLQEVTTWVNWKANFGEANSTYTVALPTNVVVNAFRPSTDTNFVHVVVFNWPTNPTATVNLSAFFPSGARLAIYDAQNIPTAYTNLTYSGSTVTLDLTLTNRASMVGTFTNPAVTWSGFDPRFRAFVAYNTQAPYSRMDVVNLIKQ